MEKHCCIPLPNCNEIQMKLVTTEDYEKVKKVCSYYKSPIRRDIRTNSRLFIF